ncbi:uncharacterized protein AMSG_07156 [Thecamonas trahens ATCC 50062]|uniref:PH domain-containing protein n=1 Tax=Thecamonas trahens ATCC 50062 TaxID=461836 RepID=A0A0L0DF53_THETB|nr:hypothetical protein AMSG_07156 [Thecamonas trahens ATCC 50062]KNC50914.1 hypothetical protein AMSG_07156 [Thecamonas trahens ATCC 50062]|eukprot:XP_013756614.1 hypothetical protein AMSG_07156 [Thecamonas trahens ATCC 50062]
MAEVSMCGYLLKRGEVNRNYSVRWFVLEAAMLWYYQSPNASKAIQSISLEDAIVRKSAAPAGSKRRKGNVYYFEVVARDKVWGLGARSAAERASWMSALSTLTMMGMENKYFIKAEEVIRQSELYKYRRRHGSRAQRASAVAAGTAGSEGTASSAAVDADDPVSGTVSGRMSPGMPPPLTPTTRP